MRVGIKEKELAFLKDQLTEKQETINKLEEHISQKEEKLKNNQNTTTITMKQHKAEMVKFVDELKTIKDKWVPPEKWENTLKQIEMYEKLLFN